MTASLTTPLPELLAALDRLDLAADTKQRVQDLAVVRADEGRPLSLDQLIAAATPKVSRSSASQPGSIDVFRRRPTTRADWDAQLADLAARTTVNRRRRWITASLLGTVVLGVVGVLITGHQDLFSPARVFGALVVGVSALGALMASVANLDSYAQRRTWLTPVRVTEEEMARWRRQPTTACYLRQHVDPHPIPLFLGDVDAMRRLDEQEKAYQVLEAQRAAWMGAG